jgi:transposase-like protein
MARTFRHLTTAEISDIVLSFNQGVSKAELARRYDIDHSTIHYHIAKYERSYPEQGGIYAVIKVGVKRVCQHPSSRCTVCGDMWDQILHAEREENDRLKRELKKAHKVIELAGLLVE